MWGSMPLMTVSMTVKIVLHSAEVVHIPHESWPSWIARYLLYKWAPLHTFGLCTRTSLQGYLIVSPSLQHTRWGFTGDVSLDHQGPLLHHVVLKRVHSFTHSFPSRRIPRVSTQSVPPVGTPRLDSTIYYIRSYPYRLYGCTVLIGGHFMNQSLYLGMMTNHRLSENYRT
jgi:hypothetical protein